MLSGAPFGDSTFVTNLLGLALPKLAGVLYFGIATYIPSCRSVRVTLRGLAPARPAAGTLARSGAAVA
jgi:hypothetical protein